MAFESGSIDQTQRVNLSEQAILIMESDNMVFCEGKGRDNFLNRIFKNFRDDAQASISIVLTKEHQKINEYLKPKKLTKEEKGKVADAWIAYLEDKHMPTKAHPKGASIKFRINNENFWYLTGQDSECGENKYYKDAKKRPRISHYLNALYEEYAEKPLYQRERIFFSEEFMLINKAIDEECQLRIQVASGRMYYVRPYKIELATYHYLTGISVPVENADSAPPQIAAFRISGIAEKMHLAKSRSGHLTEGDKKWLDKEIREKGAQFLTDNLSDIKIKLTERGVQKYRNQLHLRPKYEKILPDDVYCFKCTEIQVEYYFFKFGRDARVLEPESLVRRFSEMYKRAVKKYSAE